MDYRVVMIGAIFPDIIAHLFIFLGMLIAIGIFFFIGTKEN